MPTESTLPVEFLSTSYLGEKGQLTIPKQYLEALTLKAGAPIAVLQLGAGLLLIPEQEQFRQHCEKIASIFVSHTVTADDLLATLLEARAHVFAALYPELAQAKSAPKRVRRKKR